MLDDLRTLQRKKIIDVGKYDVLLKLFEKVDRFALPVIESAWDSIQQNNERERNEQRACGNRKVFPIFPICKPDLK